MAVTIGSARSSFGNTKAGDQSGGKEVLEEWRDVVGFEGIYQVSSLGRLRSLDRICTGNHHALLGMPLKVRLNKKGYLRTTLSKDGKRHNARIHKLVAEAFLVNDDPEHKIDINHINGIKTDNRAENLEWCTRQHNIIHSWQHGLSKPHPPKNPPKGEETPWSKLKNEDVVFIKTELQSGKHTVRELAVLFGVARQTIHKIKCGMTWKHIQIGA